MTRLLIRSTTSSTLLLLLWLVAVTTFGTTNAQDAAAPPPPSCECDCAEMKNVHEKCVADFWAVEEQRKALVASEAAATERCQGDLNNLNRQWEVHVDQIKADSTTQIERVKAESMAQLNQVKAESTSALQQSQLQSQAQLEAANVELSQCQGRHQELSGKFNEVDAAHRKLSSKFDELDTAHRRLQEVSQNFEVQLRDVKKEKNKLEKDLSTREEALGKALRNNKKVRNELEETQKILEETQKILEEMQASKTIITIDYDLLQECIEEIKQVIMGHAKTCYQFMEKETKFIKDKLIVFWKWLEDDIYPDVKASVENAVIPFVQKAVQQVVDLWEQVYAPYREPVNKKWKQIRKESKKQYKKHVQPLIKQYKLYEKAAVVKKEALIAKDMVEKFTEVAHKKLVEGAKSSTLIALNFVKLEKGPEPIITFLEKAHAEHEFLAKCVEVLFITIVSYFLLKMLFGPKKKKKRSAKAAKQQWQEKQAQQQAANVGGNQMTNKNKNQNNGAKGGKKKLK